MENKDRPAFPVTKDMAYSDTGLTKLEFLSGLAMQGILANEELRLKCLNDSRIYKVGRDEIVAKMAVIEAETLLKQLKEQ